MRTLLRRCLQKDPAKRLRDVADARLALEDDEPAPALAGMSGEPAWLPEGRDLACMVRPGTGAPSIRFDVHPDGRRIVIEAIEFVEADISRIDGVR